jgi:hypothetical protein
VICHAKSFCWPRVGRPLAGKARLRISARDPVVHCCELHQCVKKDRAGMDELHGLNAKPVEWTTKFAFEGPAARQRTILSAASAVGFVGQQRHAAYMASKGGYDFAHQGYGYRLGPILPSGECDFPGRNMAAAVLLVSVQVRFIIGGILPISGRAEMRYRL